MENTIEKEILKVKKEKNAVILAHYYVDEELQKVADYVGDSFYLAKVAKNCNADIIVFCGVSFMGESARILNPNKKVLMVDSIADCPMAHMVDKEIIRKMREGYDDLAVVCYINSTAETKCECDVCVTSSNAVDIVKTLKNKNIFFVPDQNLGSYVAKQVPEKNIMLNKGFCPVHHDIDLSEVLEEKRLHPQSLVLSHPECKEDILAVSDYIGSTAKIIDYVGESDNSEFIICTEIGIEYQLRSKNPEKKFYFINGGPCCKDMKLNTVDKLLDVLINEKNEVFVSEEVMKKASASLEKMLELAK